MFSKVTLRRNSESYSRGILTRAGNWDPWRTMKRLEQKRALPSPGKPVLLILSPSPLQVSVIQRSYTTIFQESFDYYLQVVAK